MTMGTRQHPAERLVEWVAPAMLATASAWSGWVLLGTQLGGLGSGAFALAVGILAMRVMGQPRRGELNAAFEPLSFEKLQEGDELLLDDPLIKVEDDSRVVRLFDRNEATPGELVARIEDYLGDGRRRPDFPAEEGLAAPPDASAALHAALANIRASLR